MKKKLLIIEDDDNTRNLLCMEFIDEGYQVLPAKSAFIGLELFQHNKIDLVMLDLKMPGMDGFEALEKFLNLNNQLPIIINSAYSHYKENYLTWRASDYVVKSGDLDSLKKTVNRHLATS